MPPASSDATFRRRLALTLTAIAGTVIVLWLLWSLQSLLLLTFGAILVAVILRAAGHVIARGTGLASGWATLLAAVLLLALAAIVGFFIVPSGVNQFGELFARLPGLIDGLSARLSDYPAAAKMLHQPWLRNLLGWFGAQAEGLVSSAITIVTNILFIGVGAAFLAGSPGLYRQGVIRLLPPRRRSFATKLLDEIYARLRAWLAGQLVSMLTVGVVTGLGLWLIGVPLALALGLLAGLLNIVPVLGPIVAAVPALLLAISVNLWTGLWTLILFIIVQQIEGNLLVPIIERRAIAIPPFVVLFGLFALGALFGFGGVLLAVPLMAVLTVLFERLYLDEPIGKEDESDHHEMRPLAKSRGAP